MLVLSRRVGEEITLPSCGVTVMVLAVKGNRVRLGFSAPPNVAVQRHELLTSVARMAQEANNEARG